jgi:hypothetical protein
MLGPVTGFVLVVNDELAAVNMGVVVSTPRYADIAANIGEFAPSGSVQVKLDAAT